MRKQFFSTLLDLFAEDERLFLLLGDIGVHGFRALLADFPQRALNLGILEQSMIGVSAGLASEGFIPIVHTIAPFMIERAYEQIKIDLAYQQLGANLVSVGASYDYAGLGCTHHCPADVSLMYNIPGARIILPGSAQEFDLAFRSFYSSGINYFRISEDGHQSGSYGLGFVNIQENSSTSVASVFVGPSVRFYDANSIALSQDIWYVNYIDEFIDLTLPVGIKVCKIIEDFYSGPVEDLIKKWNPSVLVQTLSPERKFLDSYGTRGLAYENIGLSQMHVNAFLASP